MKQIYFLISAFILFFVIESCSVDENGDLDLTEIETLTKIEVDDLKFSFWLSDMDDKRTNIFDEKDIKERGFIFNMSLTNNSDQNIFIGSGQIAPYLSDVFDMHSNYIGHSCAMHADILTIYKIQPGETHYEGSVWCGYDVNTFGAILLPAGKYYTNFNRNLTYRSGDNYDLFDDTKNTTTRKTIEIPSMFINFEVK